MRSYRQFCAVAKALDVVGDRWTLLIVRDLLVRGPSRYTELLNGLPGIATNLLADRLRTLARAGVVRSEDAPPPVATTLFSLTKRGEELEPVLHQLGRWGDALLAKPVKGDTFRTHWLALPITLLLADRTPEKPPIAIEVRTGDRPLTIETAGGGKIRACSGPAQDPDAVLSGPPPLIAAVLFGKLPLAKARTQGLHYSGDPSILRRLQPDA